MCTPSLRSGPTGAHRQLVLVRTKASTIPVKFRVCDAPGASIGGPQPVTGWYNGADVNCPEYQWKTTGAGPVDEQVLATPDTQFRWDATARHWVLNMNTKNLTIGDTLRLPDLSG